MLSLRSLAASFNGLNASPTSPRRPPTLSPSLSSVPNTASLNSSVVLAIFIAEPIIAPPAIPNGPPTVIKPARAPTPAPLIPAGKSLLIISFCWSPILTPSPNKPLLASSLVFKNPIPAPANNPGRIPNPVIAPGIMPARPNLSIVGNLSWMKLTTDFDNTPEPSRLLLPSTSLPKSNVLKLSEWRIIAADAPAAAPSNPSGWPNNAGRIKPINPPAAPSALYFFASFKASFLVISPADVIFTPTAACKSLAVAGSIVPSSWLAMLPNKAFFLRFSLPKSCCTVERTPNLLWGYPEALRRSYDWGELRICVGLSRWYASVLVTLLTPSELNRSSPLESIVLPINGLPLVPLALLGWIYRIRASATS